MLVKSVQIERAQNGSRDGLRIIIQLQSSKTGGLSVPFGFDFVDLTNPKLGEFIYGLMTILGTDMRQLPTTWVQLLRESESPLTDWKWVAIGSLSAQVDNPFDWFYMRDLEIKYQNWSDPLFCDELADGSLVFPIDETVVRVMARRPGDEDHRIFARHWEPGSLIVLTGRKAPPAPLRVGANLQSTIYWRTHALRMPDRLVCVGCSKVFPTTQLNYVYNTVACEDCVKSVLSIADQCYSMEVGRVN